MDIKPRAILEKLEKPFFSFVKIRLRTKMIFALVLILVLSLGIVSIFALRIVLQQFNQMAEERINTALDAISIELDMAKNDTLQKLEQTANITELKRKILLPIEGGRIDYPGLASQLSDIQKSTRLDLLEVCDREGIILASGHEGLSRTGESQINEPIIKSALEGQLVTTIMEKDLLIGNYLAIKAIVPVEHLGTVIGTLSGGYLLNRDYFNRFYELSGAHVLLLRPERELISTLPANIEQSDNPIILNDKFLEHALSSRQPIFDYIQFNGHSYRVGTKPIFANGQMLGTLVIAVSNQAIEQTVAELYRAFITLAIIGILLSVIVAYIFALRITQPVQALVDGAVAIAGGNYKQEIQITSNDEIAMLVSAFNYMAKELRENQEKLIAAIRLAEWQEVARRIAHEIKNPLTPIQLEIQNLQKCYEQKTSNLDEIFNESTQTILEEVDNLRKIVNEFSSFARMPKPQKEWSQIKTILDSTIALYNNLQQNVDIINEYIEPIPLIFADPEQLRRAFSNLIKNALDAMPQGGKLTIRIKLETISGKTYLQLEFIDTGEGMSDETIQKLFMPYYSTKKKGTGLGLSIVERIINEHNGTIKVDSKWGEGSRFTIRLPVEIKITQEIDSD